MIASGCLSGDSWFAVRSGLQWGSKAPLTKGHQGPFLSALQDDERVTTIKIWTQAWSVPVAIFQKCFFHPVITSGRDTKLTDPL